MLAKMAASTDDLAGSGFILGLGSGDEDSDAEDAAAGLPAIADRRALLSETVGALKDLFDGRGWEGGRHTPEIPGPLLPPPSRPGGPPIWIGGASDELVRMAAHQADGWNGWGLDPDRFTMKAAMLRQEAGGREVEVTWAGLAAVGTDAEEAESLAEARRIKELPPVWTGSAEQLLSWATRIRDGGASWFIVGPVMGDERMSLIARTLEGLRP
jgi:alkanesulfonate monooxygenase SsuD/methylene tetrahydromethanopterin reductase-like flavin-dependent oxidoreductase (luciferase family)